MTQLLVSVRSAREAEAALRGGAAIIDVKEPASGALGRASDATIAGVTRALAGRRPVSAALGELLDVPGEIAPPEGVPLTFVKWGLAGYAVQGAALWQSELGLAQRGLTQRQPRCRPVAVAYADCKRAQAPTPDAVCDFAISNATAAFLIDTWKKDGSTLLDWLTLPEIELLRDRCHAAGVPLALAGSLGAEQIRTLLPLCPDWFAVRGAVCQGHQRKSMIEEGKVRQLVNLLAKESEPRPQRSAK